MAPAARARSLTLQTAQRAKTARRELFVIVPLIAGTVFAYVRREELFGADTPVRVAAAVMMVLLGWALARALGRFAAPGAVQAHGPGDRRHGELPDPARADRARGAARRCGSPGWIPPRSPSEAP